MSMTRLYAWFAALGAGVGAATAWVIGQNFFLRPVTQLILSIVLAAIAAWACAWTTPSVVNLNGKGKP